MDHTIHKTEFKKAVIYNLKISYRRTIEDATAAQMYQAVALAVKDMIIDRWIATHKEYEKQDAKVVYYMSMEFLDRALPGQQYHQPLRAGGDPGGPG